MDNYGPIMSTPYRPDGSVVAKALCYKPEGRGFDTSSGDFLNLPNPSSRTRPCGLTKPLTEMSTRNIKIIMFLGSKAQWVRKADRLTTICELIV
jgi:UDP-N-acetyl-D-mannosaminuronic acid transferase (WecB/TagA/CpsF family)